MTQTQFIITHSSPQIPEDCFVVAIQMTFPVIFHLSIQFHIFHLSFNSHSSLILNTITKGVDSIALQSPWMTWPLLGNIYPQTLHKQSMIIHDH